MMMQRSDPTPCRNNETQISCYVSLSVAMFLCRLLCFSVGCLFLFLYLLLNFVLSLVFVLSLASFLVNGSRP
jgi:hypothetical protein